MKKHMLSWLWLGMLPTFNLWAAAGDVRLDPAAPTVALNAPIGLKLMVDSGTKKVGTYQVKLTYDSTKLQVDATTPITNGTNALANNVPNATTPGQLRVSGFHAQGVGPGTALHLITANFKCLGVAGSYPVALSVEALTTEGGVTIGAATPRNGVGSTVRCGSAPDFVITAISATTPAAPVTGSTFAVTVTVKNQGTGGGDGKMLSVWAHNAAVPACSATGWAKQMAVGTLAAGASKNIAFTGIPTGTVPGTKMLRAFVDSACGTGETNETNNQLTSTYTAISPLPAANLVVTAITLTPTASAINGTFTANVTVKNSGTVASIATSMLNVWNHQANTMYCGAVATKSVAIGALGAGGSKVISVTAIPAGATAGMKWLRAYADGTCTTKENNEVDNQMVLAYAVNKPAPAADFSVTSVVLNPAAPAAGATYSAVVTVKNTSTAGDGKNLEVWNHKPGIQQYCGAVGNARQNVGSVGTNLTVTKTFTGLVAGTGAAGTRTFRAYVDSACGTAETNEGNNQFTKTY